MTQYFTKSYSNFFRIPESRYFRQNAASEVYEFLQDMAYRKETAAFNNPDHIPTKRMSDEWKKGHLACFTSVSDIEKYRGLSKNTIKKALRTLRDMGLIRFTEADSKLDEPYKKEGMIYYIGRRTVDSNGKMTKETRTYLDDLSRGAESEGNAERLQQLLIDNLKPGAKPMAILNLRFDSVDSRTVRATKQVKQDRKSKTSDDTSDWFD